jgi:hypothetical protein
MLLLVIFLIKMAFIKGEPFQRRQAMKTTLKVRTSHAQKANRLILFSTGSQKVQSQGDPLFLQNFRKIGQQIFIKLIFENRSRRKDRFSGQVVRVLGYRSGGPGSIPGTIRKRRVGMERGPLSLVSTTEELLDRKVAAPV